MANEVKPWPTWVRYPLIAVFAVVVVVGLVLGVTSGVKSGVLRIVIAAVLIPALLGGLQVLGLLRRSKRLATHFNDDLERLQSRIAAELDVEAARRTTGATDQSLITATDVVTVARNDLAAGNEREAAEGVQAMPQSWFGDLGDELARCKAAAGKITRINRRATNLRP